MTILKDQRITALAAVIRELRPDASDEFARAYALALIFSHVYAHAYASERASARANASARAQNAASADVRKFTDEEKAQIDATYALLFT